jgi:hypothetical protein
MHSSFHSTIVTHWENVQFDVLSHAAFPIQQAPSARTVLPLENRQFRISVQEPLEIEPTPRPETVPLDILESEILTQELFTIEQAAPSGAPQSPHLQSERLTEPTPIKKQAPRLFPLVSECLCKKMQSSLTRVISATRRLDDRDVRPYV